MFSLVVERDQWHEMGKDEEDEMRKIFRSILQQSSRFWITQTKMNRKKKRIKVKKKTKRKVITVHLYKPVKTAHTTKVKL